MSRGLSLGISAPEPMAPHITALLNSYVRDQYLWGALESILDQESKNGFDVVLVTGLTNLSVPARLVAKAKERAINLQVVVTPPGPVGVGLFHGLRSSRGEIIAILDDDDLWAPGKIRMLEDAFERHPEIDFVHNSQVFIDQNNSPLGPFNLHRLVRHPSSLIAEGCSLLLDGASPVAMPRAMRFAPGFNNSSVTVRKSLLEEVAPLLPRLRRGEDTFLYVCALARGRLLYLVSDRLSFYRVHRTGSTVAPPPSTSAISPYEHFVLGHIESLSLAAEYVTRKGRHDVLEWLEGERAFWSLMIVLAGGRGDRREVRRWIGLAMGNAYHRPRLIDISIAALAAATMLSPRATRRAFAAWRKAW